MQAFLSILLSVVLGLGCGYFARLRGRNPLTWFIAGVFFGIFAFIVLFILPARKFKEASHFENTYSQKIFKLTILSPSHEEKLWYFLDEAKTQIGPMSFDALSKAWNEGKIQKHTYVWNESMENWQQFQEVIQPLQS
jgi:hypothetical protein